MALGTRVVAAVFVVSSATAAAIHGCAIYDASLLLPGAPDAAADAAGDAPASPGDAGDGAPADPCMHHFPPSRPQTADSPGDGGVIVAAIHALDLGIEPDGGAPPPLGYDLDTVCTCFPYASGPGAESCKPRVAGATHCDEPGGRDNSGGELLQQFAQVSNMLFSQNAINNNLNAGVYGLLVRVKGYNGAADDPLVEVDVFVSDGVAPDADGGPTVPAWDGTDVWLLDSKSVIGGGADAGGGPTAIPNYFDTNAYVAGHVLVASVDFPLSLGASGASNVVTLDLTGSVLAATLVPQGDGYAMQDGVLAGRWSTLKLLASLAAVRDPFSGSFVCPGETLYTSLKPMICKAADIFSDPTLTDATKQCDALSIGMGFVGAPAKMGPVSTTPQRPYNCDAGPDDCP